MLRRVPKAGSVMPTREVMVTRTAWCAGSVFANTTWFRVQGSGYRVYDLGIRG